MQLVKKLVNEILNDIMVCKSERELLTNIISRFLITEKNLSVDIENLRKQTIEELEKKFNMLEVELEGGGCSKQFTCPFRHRCSLILPHPLTSNKYFVPEIFQDDDTGLLFCKTAKEDHDYFQNLKVPISYPSLKKHDFHHLHLVIIPLLKQIYGANQNPKK